MLRCASCFAGLLGLLILAATSSADQEDCSQQPAAIAANTVAAYEKIGGTHGCMEVDSWGVARFVKGAALPNCVSGFSFSAPP